MQIEEVSISLVGKTTILFIILVVRRCLPFFIYINGVAVNLLAIVHYTFVTFRCIVFLCLFSLFAFSNRLKQ